MNTEFLVFTNFTKIEREKLHRLQKNLIGTKNYINNNPYKRLFQTTIAFCCLLFKNIPLGRNKVSLLQEVCCTIICIEFKINIQTFDRITHKMIFRNKKKTILSNYIEF